MSVLKACLKCKKLTEAKECTICKSAELSKNWKGLAIIIDPEGEIAKKMGVTAPGRYALRVKSEQ